MPRAWRRRTIKVSKPNVSGLISQPPTAKPYPILQQARRAYIVLPISDMMP
jgi:hypothetical protein